MSPQSYAQLFESAAAAIAALRLFQFGLHKSQRSIFVFLVVTSAYLFFLGVVPSDSILYFWGFFVTEVISWFLAVVAVHGIFVITLRRYRGLRTAFRKAIYWCVTSAGVITLAVELWAWRDGASGRSNLFYIETMNRSIVLTLAVFIAAFLLMLSRYPLRLHRNVRISSAFFCASFLAEAASMVVDTVSPDLFSEPVDTARIVFSGICMLAWASMLRPETEEKPPAPAPPRARETFLLKQLEDLDRLVTRAAGR